MTPQQWANLRALAAEILAHPADRPLDALEAAYVRTAVENATRSRCSACHRAIEYVSARCSICFASAACYLQEQG